MKFHLLVRDTTVQLKKVWLKFKVAMENQKSPSFLGRCAFVGLGLGAGIMIGNYIAKKLSENDRTSELVLALNDVSHEIKELRNSVMIHLGKPTIVDRSKRLNHHELMTKTVVTPQYLAVDEESTSEDDFFDLQDDELVFNKESDLQDNNSVLDLIHECDNLAEKTEIVGNDKALTILEDLVARNPNNVEVLWRYGRALKIKACFLLSVEDQEDKKNIAYKGMQFLDKALEINTNHGDTHKWYAILLGITAEYEPLKNKIALSHKYREHIVKAIELKPNDPTVFYLMGRWSFEIAILSWWQRQAAAALIAEPPTSSYDEALSYFLQAETLNPGYFKSNTLYIGKCYQGLGDVDKAKEWVKKALELAIKDDEDKKAHDEATTLLTNL